MKSTGRQTEQRIGESGSGGGSRSVIGNGGMDESKGEARAKGQASKFTRSLPADSGSRGAI